MKMLQASVVSVLLCVCSIGVYAQGGWKLHTSSKKAIEAFASAEEMYSKDRLPEAIGFLDQALAKDASFIEAYLLKADIYFRTQEYPKEIACIEQALAIDSMYFVSAYLNMGVAQFNMGNYNEVKGWMERFKSKSRHNANIAKADAYISKAEFAAKAVTAPVLFEPVNMGPAVNSAYDEYWPSISADGEKLIYTVLVPRDEQLFNTTALQKNALNFKEDFYGSFFVDNQWTERAPVLSINTDGNEGAQALSADGNWMFFTACGRSDSKGSCDLYFSQKTADGWSQPVNLDAPVNSPFWESQPSFSADGRTLYFVSSRPGGIGQKDIWKARLLGYKKDGSPYFGDVENLGKQINTAEDENSPFIHHDNQTLYFSSDGWPGMGKMDLFMSQVDAAGVWSEPNNLGYPLNTANDEIGLVINAKGDRGYFSSDGLSDSTTSKDLYSFEMPLQIRPNPSAYVKGLVYDSETKERIGADIRVNNLEKGALAVTALANSFTGEFLCCLPVGGTYGVVVERPGYLFYSDYFDVEDESSADKPQLLNIYLNKIKAGERMVLRNVFYATNSADLMPESFMELDQVVKLLNLNPDMKAEIGGHTDAVGTSAYNRELAEKRAKSVYSYIVEKGIEAKRLTFKGYGFDQPIESNDTEEGRAKNRRTEVKVL